MHICTLHAEVRIIEKLVYCHILYAWNTKPESSSKEAISRLEDVLSKASLHKGHVKIQKDLKLSGKTGNVPCKPSIGGAKARRFLSNHSGKPSKIHYSVWKDIIVATQDFEHKGSTRLLKVEVWKKLDDMVKILRKEIFSNNDVRLLQKSCVEFVDAVKAAWGVDHVTHYMVSTSKQKASYHFFSYASCVLPIDRSFFFILQHILRHHSMSFIEDHGSLRIWSSQGKEKSHWQARAAFHRNTQHGGLNGQHGYIFQLFQWFYRRAQIRHQTKST